ncbi:putative transcription factor MYB family [Helianthus annuus]|uniref:Transcription factor MYB family n=1 Tax=Helianthus annuus TaxID=4232 RepID=A0A9K3IH81_HELAN|nr:putative transcription factor MYB family [Helianthus annuus]KAJ0540048.1 putative transcription factor MYB-HB-like family [Helianthus annuus]KAJ0720356.1 putative transcription factor MYB-HB-like family [Helianthus annuus]KAJ0723566.1 putative transcription factor MYB-HB-like family [Helianthus annuus]KAJ0902967.1 putative transcription factor MYB-HB-like family [Helianthus annuus]
MVRPSCCDKINMRKGPWNEEGDGHMLAFVNKQTSNWQVGAPRKPGLRRCGKSCRLRKTSVTRNDNTGHENFTPQEEELIIKLHSAIGSRYFSFFFSSKCCLFSLLFIKMVNLDI